MNTIQTLLNNISYLFFQTILNDAPEPFQIGFQDGASPGYTGIVASHNSIWSQWFWSYEYSDFILSSLIVLLSILFTIIVLNSFYIHYSGGADKRNGQQIITGLGIGAAASGTYQGVTKIYGDIRKTTVNTGSNGSSNDSSSSNNKPLDKNKVNNFYFALIPFIITNIFSVPESVSAVNKIVFGILTFTTILLYCIINITGYFGILYLMKYTELENKYPKLRPFIKYYQKTNVILLIFEIFFVISSLLLVIVLCLHLLYISKDL